jgi:cold shock CspA family protein
MPPARSLALPQRATKPRCRVFLGAFVLSRATHGALTRAFATPSSNSSSHLKFIQPTFFRINPLLHIGPQTPHIKLPIYTIDIEFCNLRFHTPFSSPIMPQLSPTPTAMTALKEPFEVSLQSIKVPKPSTINHDEEEEAVTPKLQHLSRRTSSNANAGGNANQHRHQVEVPENAPRLHGVVVSRQEKFGFIKAQEHESRYFFHMRDTDGVATHGSQVTFIIAHDKTAGKDVAFDVTTISERPRTPRGGGAHAGHIKGREERIAGTYSGVVAAVPRGPSAVRIDDGMVVFTDSAGMQQQALFGAWRVVSGSNTPGLGESVEFGLVKNTATGVFKAVHVHLAHEAALAAAVASAHAALEGLAMSPREGGLNGGNGTATVFSDSSINGSKKNSANSSRSNSLPLPSQAGSTTTTTATTTAAAEKAAVSPGPGRQLGRVTLLKKEFGFIRQVLRAGDLFFHFTQLESIDPSEIKVGDDVEYSIRRDRDGKLSAQAVRRAAPGSVIFDEISDSVIEGVVLEKPVVTKQYVQSSGVLEYVQTAVSNGGENDGTSASAPPPGLTAAPLPKLRIIFSATDCISGASSLRPGDHVTFKIATNIAAAAVAAQATTPGVAQLAGKRAVEVTPVMCRGVVATVHNERKFGFIVYQTVAEDSTTTTAGANGNSSAAESFEKAEPSPPPPGLDIVEVNANDKKLASSGSSTESLTSSTSSTTSNGKGGTKEKEGSGKKNRSNRVFFHFSEVSGSLILKAGDEVAFILHTNLKNGELNAARVKRTKVCPEAAPPAAAKTAMTTPAKKDNTAAAGEAAAPAHNPNKIKFTGTLQSGEHKTQYQPKMPDGTKGFIFERLKGLDAAAADAPEDAPYVFFAGIPLKGLGGAFAPNLCVDAPVFIPKSDSVASLRLMVE